MRRALPALFAVAMLVGCQEPEPPKPEPKMLAVEHAWVRLAAVPGRPGAAYFTIKGGEAPDRLIAVTSDEVATIELHQGGMDGAMATMKPVSGADVPAGGETVFAPGGSHAMLFGVDPSVRAGASLPLAFRFQSGKVLSTNAKVLAAGEAAPEHDHK